MKLIQEENHPFVFLIVILGWKVQKLLNQNFVHIEFPGTHLPHVYQILYLVE